MRSENFPVPLAFRPATMNWYDVPLVKPVIDADVAAPLNTRGACGLPATYGMTS